MADREVKGVAFTRVASAQSFEHFHPSRGIGGVAYLGIRLALIVPRQRRFADSAAADAAGVLSARTVGGSHPRLNSSDRYAVRHREFRFVTDRPMFGLRRDLIHSRSTVRFTVLSLTDVQLLSPSSALSVAAGAIGFFARHFTFKAAKVLACRGLAPACRMSTSLLHRFINHLAAPFCNPSFRRLSASAITSRARKAESGFSDIESICRSTNHAANSGLSEGAWPQIPIGFCTV